MVALSRKSSHYKSLDKYNHLIYVFHFNSPLLPPLTARHCCNVSQALAFPCKENPAALADFLHQRGDGRSLVGAVLPGRG